MISCVFFFQAEDGIRDYKVTGVQTCALPISPRGDGVARARHLRDDGRPVDPVHRAATPGRAHPLTGSNGLVYLYCPVNINAFGLILLGGSDMSRNCTLKAVAILNPATPTDGSGRRA